jgi:nucleotide-binding universal stress UspA family protein
MEWGRIIVPMVGAESDSRVVRAGGAIASRFQAELVGMYMPPDPAELTPWLGEGFVGGVQAGAIESLREAAVEGERAARATFEAHRHPNGVFLTLVSPVWRSAALECRLADLVVFDEASAAGRGPLAETFQQILMEERAATFVVRSGEEPFATALVAWDGGEPASRAARRAVPLLRHVRRVVVAGAPLSERPCDLKQLQHYYAARGVEAEIRPLERAGDMASVLLKAAQAESAGLLVAGAFGRSRLREFVFGGTTRALLHAEQPSLFLAH